MKKFVLNERKEKRKNRVIILCLVFMVFVMVLFYFGMEFIDYPQKKLKTEKEA